MTAPDYFDEIEASALALIANQCHLIDPHLHIGEVRPLIEHMERQHLLADLSRHDANLVAELVSWALARAVVPAAQLLAAATNANHGTTRWDNPERASQVLRTIADVL